MSSTWDVLIVGGGFAGLSCARHLERVWGHDASRRVLLVSAENYFVFQPFLPEVVGASVEPRHVSNPIRRLLRHCQVQRADVAHIDPERRRVAFDVPWEGPALEPVTADHLVLALGSSMNMNAVPGMMEHGLFIKTLADAMALRGHIVRRLEEASVASDAQYRRTLLHFVAVGGGYSGVETAGEIFDLLRTARRFYRSLHPSELQVTLIHSGACVLPELDARLGAFAQRTLERRGMTVMVDQRVASVSEGYVKLADGTRIDTRNVICTIGNAPSRVLEDLPVEREKGWIVTDAYLRVKGCANVWAIGDCAINPDGFGRRAAPTAQFAVRLGSRAAKNIASSYAGTPLRAFRFRMLGQMATVGHHRGVCSIAGVRFSGWFAWWLTRTVHLLKLPGLDRKLRVVIDWTLELFFPPDLNYLDLKRMQKVSRVHVEPGDVIFHQGDRGRAFYIIEDGVLEAVQTDAEDRVLYRGTLSRGDHFGEGSLLHGLVRRATVVAKTSATLFVLGSRDFQSVVESFTSLRQLLVDTSARVTPGAELGTAVWPDALLAAPVVDIMSTPVVSLPHTSTIGDAIHALAGKPWGTLPLVDTNGAFAALVTTTDVFQAVAHGRAFDEPLDALAMRDVVPLRPDHTVREALRVLYRERLTHAPVLDPDSKPVGVLSYRDVAEARIRQSRDGSHPASPSDANTTRVSS